MSIDRTIIASQLRDAGISHAERLAELAAPSWRIVARRARGELATGQARFGGAPDLPKGFDWPTRDGTPLAFLAQLDLAELDTPDLPRQGWLLFFYDREKQPWGFDPADADGWSVAFVDDERALDRRGAPGPTMPFAACTLEIEPTVDLVDVFDSMLESAGGEIPKDQRDAYHGVINVTAGRPREFDDAYCYHHLLGHPQLVQDDMRRECALASTGVYLGAPGGRESARGQELLVQATDWTLLLQIDSDHDGDGAGWMWGDMGRLYFWIRRQDLAARAFDKVWVVLQCG